MYALMTRVFDVLERVIGRVDSGIRGFGRSLVDGPLHHIGFYLVIGVTAVVVLLKATLEEFDRLLAKVERGFIAVAMLLMTALSFLDYLRREGPGFEFEVTGGPNLAVVLMVWVGFLGASLASREGRHLSVDASDKLLSKKAAALVQRFSALLAAGFCWLFADYALALVEGSLRSGSGQDGVPLWDMLVGPINTVGPLLVDPAFPAAGLAVACAVGLLAVVAVTRQLWRSGRPPTPVRVGLDVGGMVLLVVGGLALLGARWHPVTTDGAPLPWTPVQTSAQELEVNSENLGEIANLVGGDTGSKGGTETKAEADAEVARLVAESSAGAELPMWLAQAVLPLSFLLMALRFFGQFLFGRPKKDDGGRGAPESVPLQPASGKGARDLIVAGLFPGVLLGLGAVLGVQTGWLIFIAAFLMILVGAPLFLAIGTAAVACVTLIQGYDGTLVAKDMFEAVKKEELLAIPFFVLAGNIMTQGSIAERLVGVARAAMGKTPGGLGLASIFACVIFAAISGSSPVTVIAVGSIMFPMLVKERYPESYSLGVLTSAGSLGIIIPPSVPMIIYAIMVSTPDDPLSPNDLFIGGVLPGLFIAGMLLLYTLYQTRPGRPGNRIVVPTFEDGYWSNLGRELKRSAASLMLPVLVLGGIYGVLGPIRFTVTEAAAVAVVYALFVELIIHRELKPKKLPRVLADSGTMMGSLFLIIVLAIAFNKFLAEREIPQMAAAALAAAVTSKWQFLILVNLFLLALGCVMEIISAILIVAPLLAPIAVSYGIDPVHFAIIFIVNLELGYLTPPMGINLFVSSTVFDRPVVDVIKGVVPFFILMLFCLVVIAFVPWLSLALL